MQCLITNIIHSIFPISYLNFPAWISPAWKQAFSSCNRHAHTYMCIHPPTHTHTQCKTFVETYTPQIIQLLDNDIDPKSVCKVCKIIDFLLAYSTYITFTLYKWGKFTIFIFVTLHFHNSLMFRTEFTKTKTKN